MKNWVNRLTERVCVGARWILEMLEGEEVDHHAAAKAWATTEAISERASADPAALRRAADLLRAEGQLLMLAGYEGVGDPRSEASDHPHSLGVMDGTVLISAADFLYRRANQLDPKVAP